MTVFRNGLCLLLSLAALANAQNAKITGRVVNSLTDAPIQRATVALTSATSAVAVTETTDAAGNFSFTNLQVGNYVLSARRPGFIDAEYGAHERELPATPLRLTSSQEINNVTFKMTPQGILVVKVVGEDGEPVRSSLVQVMTRTPTLDGRSRVSTAVEGRTNDLGEFRAAGLPPTTYYVAATPSVVNAAKVPVARLQGLTADEDISPTFYPESPDPAKAVALRLEPGQELPVAITLQRGRTYRIRGTLPAPKPGTAFSGLALIADDTSLAGGIGQRATGVLGPEGTFEIAGVLPGAYSVLLLGAAGARDVVGAVKAEVVDRDVEGLAISPIETLTIQGHISMEEQKDINFSGLRVSLAPADNLTTAMGSTLVNRAVPVSADGVFSIPGVPQGHYRVQAAGLFGGTPMRVYLKTIRLGDQDSTKVALDLTTFNSAPSLDLIFSPKAASLGVITIYESETSPRGTAIYVPEPYPADPRLATSGFTVLPLDQTGYAQANNMPPGKYRVYAFEQYDPLNGIDQPTLKLLEAKSELISLGDGGFERVNVKQIRAADVPR